MTKEEFYGETLEQLEYAKNDVIKVIENYRKEKNKKQGKNPLEYYKARIKSPESMINKLNKRHLPIELESALYLVKDAVGIRVVLDFIDEIYDLVTWIKQQSKWEIIQEKDYILYPKENGYRSYHIILRLTNNNGQKIFVEIQIRTIAMDFWASLEHQLKYKKEIKYQKTIVNELKRCADEIASIDVSMQTIKELLNYEEF